MQEAGSGVAVMGNHDLNAVCLATPDPASPGAYLRPHTQQNLRLTAATRAEMERDPEEALVVLNWLRRLPLWLELDRLRIAHAGWCLASMEKLRPWIDERRALTDEGLVRAARKGDPVRHAREMLLNGLEANLPNNMRWIDYDGKERPEVRLPWWLAGDSELTWRTAARVPNEVRSKLPDTPLPEGILGERDDDASRPIFFGHYWMGWPLAPLTSIHACVDASVAAIEPVRSQPTDSLHWRGGGPPGGKHIRMPQLNFGTLSVRHTDYDFSVKVTIWRHNPAFIRQFEVR
jgi:hypothetical protein